VQELLQSKIGMSWTAQSPSSSTGSSSFHPLNVRQRWPSFVNAAGLPRCPEQRRMLGADEQLTWIRACPTASDAKGASGCARASLAQRAWPGLTCTAALRHAGETRNRSGRCVLRLTPDTIRAADRRGPGRTSGVAVGLCVPVLLDCQVMSPLRLGGQRLPRPEATAVGSLPAA